MKKLRINILQYLGIGLLLSGQVINLSPLVGASGYDENFTVRATLSKPTAKADGADAINVKVSFFRYVCNAQSFEGGPRNVKVNRPEECDSAGGVYGEEVINHTDGTCSNGGLAYASIGGEGNTISPEKLCADANGHANFTVKSTVVGTKTVTVTAHVRRYPGEPAYESTKIGLTFVKPATATPKPQPAALAAPELSSIMIGSNRVWIGNPISFASSVPLTLGGKTVPGGVVSLYIFSDPRMATVTADDGGNWNYTVTDLSIGEHHIEAEVTDPATSKTSDRKQLLSFTVTEPLVPKNDEKAGISWYWWLLSAAALAGASAAGYIMIRRNKGREAK